MVLRGDGTVWGWGPNSFGELGDGTTTRHPTPVLNPNLSRITQVAMGFTTTLALRADGTVWASGSDGLGNGTSTPVQVPGLSHITHVAGGKSHSLALRADGTVWSWGRNTSGQLGDGRGSYFPTPMPWESHPWPVLLPP
jgi:alpha-tubulin suppressor-like RCC1 family protein